jgi:predicted small integral membrane protein
LFTVLDLRTPSRRRRGAFGVATTRGDRLFLGLLGAAFVLAAWLATVDGSAVPGAMLAAAWLATTLRWG